MRRLPALDGFAVRQVEGGVLVLDTAWSSVLAQTGLADPRRWADLLAAGEPGGRGTTARIAVGSHAVRLKQLRRGGLLAGLWRERFLGTRRLLDNLTIPREVARRGIPTPRTLALLILEGPRGLFRGWLAAEEVGSGGHDLLAWLHSPAPPTKAELGQAMRLVRQLHDAGVHHRDLHLGNLLLARQPEALFVIDLDRARLERHPLALRTRVRALARLERSLLKQQGGLADPPPAALLWEAYADGDPALGARLARARRRRLPGLLLRRLGGWR